ncbi:MAG: flagellar FlbD family protein [Leptospiraceae bacterium]|nr:flagellar FlbD family protein [Leptospiraceae bacterium]MCP5496873.1 flagellar FlbD family protein [Leptospiraceae bacterium]
MIVVHRLNNSELIINAQHIESIEATPDSVITFSNDKKIIVRESASELVDKIIEYHQKIFQLSFKLTKEEE